MVDGYCADMCVEDAQEAEQHALVHCSGFPHLNTLVTVDNMLFLV